MRAMRRRAGARFSNKLFVYDTEDGEHRLFDSGHYIGAKRILKYMKRNRDKKV